MPRDAGETRERLIDAGQHLFAADGVFTTPLKRVVDAAGQRNPSALHYHFGGRSGLLFAIIERHNAQIEAVRQQMLDSAVHPSLYDLVRAFVLPQSNLLADEGGREFLSIISQLSDTFDRWDDDEKATPPQALRTMRMIDAAMPSGLSPVLRRERITRFLELVTEALGGRARQVASGRSLKIDDTTFTANLIDMAVGALSAPPTGSG
jgi:TetR/AcrR family transcriptional regulator, regulator of cefoperazone and chloramphenicol sensitivity